MVSSSAASSARRPTSGGCGIRSTQHLSHSLGSQPLRRIRPSVGSGTRPHSQPVTEGQYIDTCREAISPAAKFSGTFFSHYSLLGTTEQLLGLPKLGQASSSATMTAAFHL
jgi:hypothetical protein